MNHLSYRESKKDRISKINNDLNTEIDFLKAIYGNLAGQSPELDITQEVSKPALLSALSALIHPPAVPATYETVTSLPATLENGRLVLYNGTLYRGLVASESIFAAGTPWPVKGYKEYTATLASEEPLVKVLQDDINETITWSTSSINSKSSNVFPPGTLIRLGLNYNTIEISLTTNAAQSNMAHHIIATATDVNFYIVALVTGSTPISDQIWFSDGDNFGRSVFSVKIYPPKP
ncbi:MAG: hypothetical protein KGZ82_08610 [Bacteroidales bacterium]|nr:hypothetical protein [Bacteroidales bacterium]